MMRSRTRSTRAVPSVYSPAPTGSDATDCADSWSWRLTETSRLQPAASSRLSVSIVICTRNRPAELKECLEHVSALKPCADEVIVVDNSHGDREVERLARAFGVRYIIEKVPGLSRARNTGLSESRCEIVAYLDDDCIAEEDWLEHLLQPFAEDRVAATAGGIVRFHDRAIPLRELRSAPAEMRYVNRETPCWFEIASFGGIGSGCNMAFRKRACDDFLLFDERLGRGAPIRIAEENCAFVSLLTLCHAVVRIPAACVYHPEKPRNPKQEAASAIAYSLLLFSRFPRSRMDLFRFLIRRTFKRTSAWRISPQQAGDVVAGGWGVKLWGTVAGVALFFRARRMGSTAGRSSRQAAVTVIPSKRVQTHSP